MMVTRHMRDLSEQTRRGAGWISKRTTAGSPGNWKRRSDLGLAIPKGSRSLRGSLSDLPHGAHIALGIFLPFIANKLGACLRNGVMNNVDQFNKGGFSLWWSFFWLQAISYAWAVVSLLGIFLHSKRLSELGDTLSGILLRIALLTAAAQCVLRVFRRVKSR
jgi:hypothetical protein